MLNNIRIHWSYLKYVVKHKYYVYKYGRILNVGIWQLLIHDWQKFLPVEWIPYALSFYGPWKYDMRPEWLVDAFDRAWLHHIHYGPHHWQYWLLQEDSGKLKILEMPDKYINEMVADWCGASIAITGGNNTLQWYEKNREKIILAPDTKHKVIILLESLRHEET